MSLAGPNSSPEEQRLEVLLSSYEKNLRTEVFFIRQKDMASLLELLPQQDDLIRAIGALFQSITLLPRMLCAKAIASNSIGQCRLCAMNSRK